MADFLEINYRTNLIFCGKEEACEFHVGEKDRLVATIFNIEPEPTYDYILKWGGYDKDFNLIVLPELDEEPIRPKIKSSPRSRSFSYYEEYYVLKKDKKYGVLCNDGRWIANIELTKEQVKTMINSICEGKYSGDLYI